MKKHKSVCFVIPNIVTSKVGGAELQVYFISEELLKRGWEVEMLSLKPIKGSVYYQQYYNPKIKYHFYTRFKRISLLEFFSVLFQLFKTNSAFYYQRTDYYLTASTAFFCKIKRRKMIYALADDDCVTKDRYFNYFNKTNKQNSIFTSLRRIEANLLDWMLEKAKKYSHYIISQTFVQKQILLRDLEISSSLIRNSYPFSNKINLNTKENIIIWVGNLRKDKNPEIFAKLASELKISGWKFIMIGSNKNYYKDVEDIKLDNFIYLGSLSLEETETWFSKAKIIINTGEMEGFPNVFIQAWFFKVYVMSLYFDPDNLIVENNLGTYLQGSYDSLKEELNNICSNYDKYSLILDNAQQFALNEFEITKNVDKLEKLIL